jgi:hypothetical protein
MAEAQIVTIGNEKYELDNLSDVAKTQLGNLRIADQEITRLKRQLSLVQTARQVYSSALKAELPDTNK